MADETALSCDRRSGSLCQANERRFECTAVTRRRVHVTCFRVRRDGASAAAHGHKRTLAALVLVRTQMFETFRCRFAPALDPAIDVTH